MKISAAAHKPAPPESFLAEFKDCTVQRVAAPAVAVGVDVGEDFLDLAVVRLRPVTLKHHRIALTGIEADPPGILRTRLTALCPDTNSQWLALIDSPRWPVDLDCSSRQRIAREPVPPGRILDRALRAMLRASDCHNVMRLSMFPTPRLGYFTNCVKMSGCKVHLASTFRRLFPGVATSDDRGDAPMRLAGGTFTRFMLAGFLTFQVWQDLGVQTLEAYPDLQFRLSCRRPMPAKRAGNAALAARKAVIRRLRRSLGIERTAPPATHDQADAEILALSAVIAARQGSLAALEHPAEGRFVITFKTRDTSGVAKQFGPVAATSGPASELETIPRRETKIVQV